MSDRDELLALLEKWALPWREPLPVDEMAEDDRQYAKPDANTVTIGPDVFPTVVDARFHRFHEGDKDRVDGYGGFVCNFEFTPEGEFLSVGVWE